MIKKVECSECYSLKMYCPKCSFLNCMYQELENGNVYKLFRDYIKNHSKNYYGIDPSCNKGKRK